MFVDFFFFFERAPLRQKPTTIYSPLVSTVKSKHYTVTQAYSSAFRVVCLTVLLCSPNVVYPRYVIKVAIKLSSVTERYWKPLTTYTATRLDMLSADSVTMLFHEQDLCPDQVRRVLLIICSI